MRKMSLDRTILIFILAVIFGIFINSGTVWAENNIRTGKIKDFQGDVRVFRAGGEKSFAAFTDMLLFEGDTVMTPKDSQVILALDEDKEIKLAASTTMTINQLRQSVQNQAQQTALNLKKGKIFCNIRNKLTSGSQFAVWASDTVFKARGTMFFVGESDGKTDVAVLEGTVVATAYIPVEEVADGRGTEQRPVEIVLERNEQIRIDGNVRQDVIKVEEVKTETLDLFVLETIKEDPTGINTDLLKGIDNIIEERREEQRQQEEKQRQEQNEEQGQANQDPAPVIIYDEVVTETSDSSSDSSDPPSTVIPQFVRARTIDNFTLELVFDQEIALVDSDPSLDDWKELFHRIGTTGQTLLFSDLYGGANVDSSDRRRLLVRPDNMTPITDAYTANDLFIAAGAVRCIVSGLTNAEITNKVIEDGIRPAFEKAIFTAANKMEIHFSESVAFSGTAAQFMDGITDTAADTSYFTGGLATVSGKVITITLDLNLADLTYETNGLKIAAGCVKDLRGNTNSLLENKHAANWLPPQLVTNNGYQTIDGLFPVHGTLTADASGNMVLTFNRGIILNLNAVVQLKKYSDDSLIEEIRLQDLSPANQPAENVLILPHAVLEASTQYYVIVPANAFGISASSDVFFGGTGKATWNFTTSSP